MKIFRNIRQKLAAENKIMAYLRYAIGEIVLVVIGILIALQVNDWNKNRIEKEEFNFGMNEFYKQMQIDVFSYSAFLDRFTFQVLKMDSIINGFAEEMNTEQLPGIIQLFDDNGDYLISKHNEWQKNFLKLKPGDERQNNTVRMVRKYFEAVSDFQNVLISLNMDNLMIRYLREWNIPVRFFSQGDAYSFYISDYPPNFYSKSDLSTLMMLIKNPSFIADLKSLSYLEKQRIHSSEILIRSGQKVSAALKKDYPDINNPINNMEIIGTATPRHDWSLGTPMKKISDNSWEVTIDLTDGEIKFRTDAAWTFDWGQSESNPNNLVFIGGNIPVKNGKYRITINIYTNSYELKKLDKQ